MGRLTSWNKDCVQINGHALNDATRSELVQMAERLAAYEDTGLEPEAVETVKLALAAKHLVDLETLNNTPISRLVELAEADEDGRVIILPCKVGDTVWLSQMFYTRPKKPLPVTVDAIRIDREGVMFITGRRRFYKEAIGRTVFLTREEAEKAMKGDTEK
nr:MAG TPA: hypothetical protein [Caudoviricetes sp.]